MSAYETQGQSDEWYTPKYVFDAIGEEFDLDVAAPKDGPRYVPAKDWFWHSGEFQDWRGFVWMNPPFGNDKHKRRWLSKFFRHRHGIALLPDRTSSGWFQDYAPMADALLMVGKRIQFERHDGSIGRSPGTGTVLMAAGERARRALERSGLGMVVYPVKRDAA